MKTPTTSVGTATMTAIAIRSDAERRTARAPRSAPPVFNPVATSTATAWLRAEDRLLLLLDVRDQSVHVVGLVEELLQCRDHDRRREIGPGVTVHVLRDVLGATDQLGRLLLQNVVVRRRCLLVRGGVVRVALQVDVVRLGTAEERQQLLRAGRVLRLL